VLPFCIIFVIDIIVHDVVEGKTCSLV